MCRPYRASCDLRFPTRGDALRRCRGALPRADLFRARWAEHKDLGPAWKRLPTPLFVFTLTSMPAAGKKTTSEKEDD